MPGRDSSRIRNGKLIQWAYDQLALTRSVVISVFRYLDTDLRCKHSKHSCHKKYL